MDNFDRCFTTIRVALPKHKHVSEKRCYLKTASGCCSNTSCGNCGRRCLGWAKCSNWTSREGYVRRNKSKKIVKKVVKKAV